MDAHYKYQSYKKVAACHGTCEEAHYDSRSGLMLAAANAKRTENYFMIHQLMDLKRRLSR
jgi:hypothetical protein